MMTISNREAVNAALLLLVSLLLLACALGCSESRTLTGPSVAPAVSSAIVAPVAADPVPVPAPAPAPPVAADPPTPSVPAIPSRPFARTDCDYSNLSAIRCYNPSDQTIVLSAGVIVNGAAGCNLTWAGKHENVVIAPRTNGYFTLPGPTCAVYQLDFFFGATVGRCLNPDFTAERTYASTSGCAPPPPPPPPVCVVEPAGACSDWTLPTSTNKGLPAECTKRAWVRSCPMTCGAKPLIETLLSCEKPR